MKGALFKQLLLFLVWPDVKDELLDITTLDFFLKKKKKKTTHMRSTSVSNDRKRNK